MIYANGNPVAIHSLRIQNLVQESCFYHCCGALPSARRRLTTGPGNVFRSCIAHHNIDDGWDLFTKTDTGPISPVTIENCISFSNGAVSNGGSTTNSDGNGFKLGDDGIAVNHNIRR